MLANTIESRYILRKFVYKLLDTGFKGNRIEAHSLKFGKDYE